MSKDDARPGKDFCRDFGQRPGCLRTPDEAYTMRFDDIGEPPIRWCSSCGREAHAINAALVEAFESRPGFAKELESAMDQVEADRRRDAN